MNERHPEATELDDTTQKRIEHLTDTLGLSWADAKQRLGVHDEDTPAFTRDESWLLHPSNAISKLERKPQRNYESRYDGDTFPVIDTFERSDAQVIINAVGAAGVRAATSTPDDELSPLELARKRAKEQKRGLRW